MSVSLRENYIIYMSCKNRLFTNGFLNLVLNIALSLAKDYS